VYKYLQENLLPLTLVVIISQDWYPAALHYYTNCLFLTPHHAFQQNSPRFSLSLNRPRLPCYREERRWWSDCMSYRRLSIFIHSLKSYYLQLARAVHAPAKTPIKAPAKAPSKPPAGKPATNTPITFQSAGSSLEEQARKKNNAAGRQV
jgi:hypothetical protein